MRDFESRPKLKNMIDTNKRCEEEQGNSSDAPSVFKVVHGRTNH